MNDIKTFVSFCSADNLFVRHFLARLHVLNFNPWDYSDEGSELPIGRPITPSLRTKIDDSSLCIIIVSDNSTASPHCHSEVAHMMDLYARRPLPIVPLVDTHWADPKREWPGAFAELKKQHFCYSAIDTEDPFGIELPLNKICQMVGKAYQPPAQDAPHFPFMTRLYRELLDREDKGNASFRRLYDKQRHFNCAITKGDYKEANRLIDQILALLDSDFPPRSQFYYPMVAKGICQAQCAEPSEALQTFYSLKNHPLCDDNLSQAIGYVLSCQKRYREAALSYSEAWLIDRKNIAALHGFVVNTVFAGGKISDEQIRQWITECMSDDPAELAKISEMKGLVLLSNERHGEAANIFRALTTDAHCGLGALIQCSESLLRDKRTPESLELLRSFQEQFGDNVSFLEQVARTHRLLGNQESYIEIMDKLAVLEPKEWKHVMRKALALLELGRDFEARELSLLILSLGRPETDDNCYYRGMAYYISGQLEIAEHDFRDSRRSSDWHYSELVPKQ